MAPTVMWLWPFSRKLLPIRAIPAANCALFNLTVDPRYAACLANCAGAARDFRGAREFRVGVRLAFHQSAAADSLAMGT
jgi:hypothetical protein